MRRPAVAAMGTSRGVHQGCASAPRRDPGV